MNELGEPTNADREEVAGRTKGGLLGGILACLYCIIAGGLGLAGGAYNFFVNSEASVVAVIFGFTSLLLMIWLSQRPSTFLFLLGRNLTIAFAVVLVILFFVHSMPPGIQQIMRLVLQLALVWIIFSTFRHMRLKASPGVGVPQKDLSRNNPGDAKSED